MLKSGLRIPSRQATLGPGAGYGTVGGATTFYAPLRTCINAWTPTGNLNPTYTRATAAYVQDHEGVMRQVLAGEARFWGARRVRNCVTSSQTLSDGTYNILAATGTGSLPTITPNQIAPDGSNTAYRLVLNLNGGTGGADVSSLDIGATAISNTGVRSIWAKSNTGSSVVIGLSRFGTFAGEIVTVTPVWTRVFSTPLVNTNGFTVALRGAHVITFGESGSADITVWHPQWEDVTGQSVQTPSEYVSTGVLSAPYQGTGVDGVQYFETKLDGTLIPSTTLLGYLAEAAGTQLVTPTASIRGLNDASWVASGGTSTTAKTSTGIDAVPNSATRVTATGANAVLMQAAPVTSAGNYVASFYIRRVTGTGNVDITVDGGTTWSTISGSINSSTYTKVQVTRNLALNTARIGLRLVTSGDAVDVDFAQLESGTAATSPMSSAGAARNGDVLSFSPTGTFNTLLGSAYIEVTLQVGAPASTSYLLATSGGAAGVMAYNAAGVGMQATDGTNFPVALGGVLAANTLYKCVTAWDAGGTIRLLRTGSGSVGSASCVAGGLSAGASTIVIGTAGGGGQPNGTLRNVRIYTQKLSDTQLIALAV